MEQSNIDKIRQTANWLKSQTVSSNADPHASVTKHDLENLKNNVAKAINAIADALED